LVVALRQVVSQLPEQLTQVTLAEDHEMVQLSVRIVFTKRSACGLQFGLWAGIGTHVTPLVCSNAVHASVNTGSGSWIRYLALRSNPSAGSSRRDRSAAEVRHRFQPRRPARHDGL
jgi:hypothetical protein